jgi:hypothetical protein
MHVVAVMELQVAFSDGGGVVASRSDGGGVAGGW